MRPRGIFLFLFCALSDALPALAQPTITEYPLPTASSSAAWIARGPDGNLWFTEYATNMVAKITTSGVITEYSIPTPNSGPAGLTVGPDGNLWFPEILGNKIAKVTPTGTPCCAPPRKSMYVFGNFRTGGEGGIRTPGRALDPTTV